MKHGSVVVAIAAVVTVAAALTLVTGCGGPPPVYNLPEKPSGYWETAWVEPHIIVADSVFTLIRAERVDSVYVRLGQGDPAKEPPSIDFAVESDSCFVSVNLALGSDRGVSYPLIARVLPHGNYKLSINQPIKLDEFAARQAIELRGTICGVRKVVPVAR